MKNLYKTSPEKPFHLSVGAILIDSDKKLVCHYWKKLRDMEDIYFFMKETINDNETLEEALNRGLAEEFGAKGEIISFIGSRVTYDNWFGEINKETEVQKTTLFYLVKLTGFESSLRKKEGIESESEILHLDIDTLIEKFKVQGEKYKWSELKEYEILERVRSYIESINL